MRYLVVKNYKKMLHQDGLPWMKFFTALLAPTKEPELADLTDALKCQLYHLWLMALVHNNRIPENWLTPARLNLKSKVSLQKFIDLGYVWFEGANEDSNSPRLDSHAIEFDSKNLNPRRGKESKPKSEAKALVEEFLLLPKHREWAAKNTPSVPIETELEAWKDRCRNALYTYGKGRPIGDAQASFYTAMRNAEAWGTYRSSKPTASSAPHFQAAPMESTLTISPMKPE